MCAVRFCSRVSQFFSQVFPLCPDFPAFYLFCSLPACCCHITLLWSFFYISQCLPGTLSFNYFVDFPISVLPTHQFNKRLAFCSTPLDFLCLHFRSLFTTLTQAGWTTQQKCVTLSHFEVAFYMNTGRHNFTVQNLHFRTSSGIRLF